jgi:hypothetical protein
MKYKAQDLHLLGKSVIIQRHRRQAGGGFGTVRDWFWRKEEPWLVLQLPSGSRVAVPLSWTDLPQDILATSRTTQELCPLALMELARYCRRLRGRKGRRAAGKRSAPRSRR